MKKYFITGLVILTPLALTLAIVFFILNVLTDPFVGIVKSILGHYNLLDTGFLFLSGSQIQQYFSQLIVIVLLFLLTVGLGWLARWFFINYIFNFWGSIFSRIPVINSLYRACQDVIQTLFTSKSSSFKQVVLVPFPSTSCLSIGFVTRDLLSLDDNAIANNWFVTVFIPTTPNPTSGYLSIFNKSDLIYVDMKVEDALKYIISCGVIPSPLSSSCMNEIAKKLNQHK